MSEKSDGFKYANILNSFRGLDSVQSLGLAFFREIHRISKEQRIDPEELCKGIAAQINLEDTSDVDKVNWVRARFAEAIGSK